MNKIMKFLMLFIFTSLFFTSPLIFAKHTTEFLPLEKGNYWTYQDKLETQDENGDIEVENKYLGEKVKIKRTTQIRTLTVLSTETRGDFKIAKIQEGGTPDGIITFFYIVDNKNGKIYSYSDEQIKTILPNDKDVNIEGSPEYIFPIQVGSRWGDPESLARKDKMYIFFVEKIEDITVPAGTFKNCFKIVHYTLPDETIQWFCPYVGIVRLEYRHHGPIDNLVSELKKVNLK